VPPQWRWRFEAAYGTLLLRGWQAGDAQAERSVFDREIDVGCELSLEWWEAISMGCCSTFSLTEDNNNETCQLTGLPLHTTRYLPNTCCGRWVCKNSIALRCGAMLCLAVNKSLALSRMSVCSKVAEKRK